MNKKAASQNKSEMVRKNKNDNGHERLSRVTTLTFAFLGAVCSHRNICRQLCPSVNNGGRFVCADKYFLYINKFMETKKRKITEKCCAWCSQVLLINICQINIKTACFYAIMGNYYFENHKTKQKHITNMHSKLQKHQFTMHFLNFAFFNYAHSATMLCLYNCSKMHIMYLINVQNLQFSLITLET